MTEKDIARFWSKVNKDGPIPPHRPELGKCWVWTAGKNGVGYGMIRRGGLLPHVLAHRLSWEIHYTIIPPTLCVLHRCDNPACVNPHHLFVGTKGDNNRDCVQKERRHGMKLSEKLVKEIRLRHKATGDLHKKIAQCYGLKTVTVTAVLSGRTWKHVK